MEEKALGRPKIMGDLEDLQKVSDGILQGSNASLDTFKEVGIALGNDPNFSTNITKQITGCNTEIGKIKEDIRNVDVSWGKVTGKPTEFPPTQHYHSYLSTSGGSIDGGLQFNGIRKISWNCNRPNHTEIFWNASSTDDYGLITRVDGVDSIMAFKDLVRVMGDFRCRTLFLNDVTQEDQNATASSLRVERGSLIFASPILAMDIPFEIQNLKQSVVNGKHEVATAIDGKLGYVSGLGGHNTHADLAWWISHKIPIPNIDNLGSSNATRGYAVSIVCNDKRIYGNGGVNYSISDFLFIIEKRSSTYTISSDQYFSYRRSYQVNGPFIKTKSITINTESEGYMILNPTNSQLRLTPSEAVNHGGLAFTIFEILK